MFVVLFIKISIQYFRNFRLVIKINYLKLNETHYFVIYPLKIRLGIVSLLL